MQTGSRWRLDMVAVRARWDRERAATIAKYEQGRRGAALFEPEEEDDSGYLFPDRLGFLHEKMLPQASALGTKQKHMETQRLQKWVKMLKNYHKYCDSEQFHRRCFKGIPSQVRGNVWMLMLNVNTKKAQNVGKYKAMKEQSRLQSLQFHQINWAVQGTFRSHLMFQERYGARQQALFDVLMAYTVYNPEGGYGQGLSHITALLLMWLSEEDAFWALVQLLENRKYSMYGLYKPGLPKLEMLQNHLEDLVHRTLPALEQHLEEQGLNLKDCTAHWFTQCFLDVAPFSLALRMWDIFILEGEHVLTTMAYTMLKVHRKRLLKMPRDHLQEFLQETLKKTWVLDDDVFIKQLQASKRELGNLHCLLPPQAKPDECCSLCLGLPRVSLEWVPPPKTPRCSSMAPDTAQEQLEGITSHPEGPHLPESSSLHMILKSSPKEEAKNSAGGKTKCQDPGSCGVTSECVGARAVSPGPKDAWKGKMLSSWASNSCLRLPAKGAGCPPPELGSQQGLVAPSTPALVRVVPAPISPADQAVGLKTSHLQSVPGSPPCRGERPSLKPSGVIAVPGPQPWVPSPASGILAIRSLGQLQLSRLLQEWAHSLPGFSMLASMLHRAPFRGFCSFSLRGVTLGQLMR